MVYLCIGFGLELGLGFRVRDGVRSQGLGSAEGWDQEFRVWGLGLGVWGMGRGYSILLKCRKQDND